MLLRPELFPQFLAIELGLLFDGLRARYVLFACVLQVTVLRCVRRKGELRRFLSLLGDGRAVVMAELNARLLQDLGARLEPG